jgi:hypothetical protein
MRTASRRLPIEHCDDGTLNHDALRGGYVFAAMESPAEQVLMLETRRRAHPGNARRARGRFFGNDWSVERGEWAWGTE